MAQFKHLSKGSQQKLYPYIKYWGMWNHKYATDELIAEQDINAKLPTEILGDRRDVATCALTYALMWGDWDLLLDLLNNGADVNAIDDKHEGKSILQIAVDYGRAEMAYKLAEKKAEHFLKKHTPHQHGTKAEVESELGKRQIEYLAECTVPYMSLFGNPIGGLWAAKETVKNSVCNPIRFLCGKTEKADVDYSDLEIEIEGAKMFVEDAKRRKAV